MADATGDDLGMVVLRQCFAENLRPHPFCLAWKGPVGGQRDLKETQWRFAAAVTEADYNAAYYDFHQCAKRDSEGGLNQHVAWQILAWVWGLRGRRGSSCS